MYNVSITVKRRESPWIKKLRTGKHKDVIVRAANKLANMTIQHAQEYYISKRKSDDPVSMIIDSFGYELQDATGTSFNLLITAGGPSAPYAKYVEHSRKGFEGYGFMKKGAEYAKNNATRVVREEVQQSMRGI